MKKLLFILLFIFSMSMTAQYNRRDGNRIGLSGGITRMSLITSNFATKPSNGWIGGLSIRGNYYNDFIMTFGMNFTESNFTVATFNTLLQAEDVNYKLMAAQIRLVLSYNLIEDHLSIEAGPVLQINDKLKINSNDENNVIAGSNLLTAIDITDITKINGNIYAGLSAGTKKLKIVLSYQYGLNNIMNNLNKSSILKLKNNNSSFQGNIGIISGQLMFNL
jgi:hypothetical protein